MPELKTKLNKPGKYYFLITFILLMCANLSYSQDVFLSENLAQQDTVFPEPQAVKKDPQKAALYSAVLPGAGQYYNEKYWKMPIVYVGFGTLIYFIDRNTKYYKDLKGGLIDFPDHDLKYFDNNLTYEQIERGKDIFKRYRDMSYIFTAGFYVLQIIDATVDAYLFDWDVGEDISLRMEPASIYTPVTPYNSFGVRACISF